MLGAGSDRNNAPNLGGREGRMIFSRDIMMGVYVTWDNVKEYPVSTALNTV